MPEDGIVLHRKLLGRLYVGNRKFGYLIVHT